jgi:hypothetical protein
MLCDGPSRRPLPPGDRGVPAFQEFPLVFAVFALAVDAPGIRHGYIRARRPWENGKVARSHRIDHKE